MAGRKKRRRFGLQCLPAEYGMRIELTKPEILDPEQVVALQEKGVRFMAACLDADDTPECLVFGVTRSAVQNTAGLFCRALGEVRRGLDPTLALRVALSQGTAYIQMTERASDLLKPYVLEIQGSSGNCGLRTFEGLSEGVGCLPAEISEPCRCERCAARGGW